jgi:aminoglycoside phosphotransferase
MQKDTLDLRVIEALVTRIFSHTIRLSVEKMEEGVSTHVYKIYRGNEVFYLRILPEVGASFAPEAHVHTFLREKNVKVPEIVYFEHCNVMLQRSIMVTTEIKGRPISHYPVNEVTRNVLAEAGRDLAVVNGLRVEKFGWIRRDSSEVAALEAEFPTYRAFVFEHLEEDLALLSEQVLNMPEIMAIRQIIGRCDTWLDLEQAWLAHGDFDMTHIYQENGRYTGIIDFGEIRGADPFYDLGHFRMYDGETLPAMVLPYLLEGYRELVHLPPDYEQRVHFSSLLIAIRTLARSMKKRSIDFRRHAGFWSIKRDIEVLHGNK